MDEGRKGRAHPEFRLPLRGYDGPMRRAARAVAPSFVGARLPSPLCRASDRGYEHEAPKVVGRTCSWGLGEGVGRKGIQSVQSDEKLAAHYIW